MINATELRIGNWVWNPDDEGGIYYFKISAIANNAIAAEPVLLTPEILEKCGFKTTSIENQFFQMMDLQLSRNRHISVHNVGTPNEIVFVADATMDEHSNVVVRNYDYDGKTHLHQLQNIIHALTGQELQINL